jgi:hypothetical protein
MPLLNFISIQNNPPNSTALCNTVQNRTGPTAFICLILGSKGRYTLSVKLSDFIVWRHTWRKNWVNCAVLTGNSEGLRTVLSSRLSHKELRTSLRESHILNVGVHSFSNSFHNLQHQFLAINSADEHRVIYSFSSTTSYSTFYAFFSSFRITLWPMWLANSKRQPCFYPSNSHAQEDTQNWQTWWETCAVQENIQFSFSCIFFFFFKLHSLTYSVWGSFTPVQFIQKYDHLILQWDIPYRETYQCRTILY